MATPNTKRVPIELDRRRTLLLDLNAYCTAEELTGRNYMKPETWGDMNFRDVRALVLAGLKHEDPTLTLEQVGAMISTDNLTLVSDALTQAFVNSMPEKKAEDTERPLERSPEIRAIEMELDRELSLTPT